MTVRIAAALLGTMILCWSAMARETYDAAGNLTTQEGTPVYNYDSFSMIDQIDKRRSGTITQQRILYGPDDERIGIVLDEGVLSRWKIRDFSGKVLREYRANDDGNF